MRIRAALAGVVAAWAVWRMFGPHNPPRSAGPQQHPLPIPGRSIFVGRHEYFVRETGPADGMPLVLIHGWVYDSVATFHRLVPMLADRYRLILIDQRNYGGSARVHADYDIEDIADEIAATLDALDLPPVVVFGYSMGGMVAMALAYRHPGRVDRLILGATAAWPIRGRAVPLAMTLAGRGLWRLGLPEAGRGAAWYLRRVKAFDDVHHAWLWDTLLSRDPDLNMRAVAAIRRFDARDWVGRLPVPTLVIVAGRDQIIRFRYQYELAEGLKNATVLELAEARHEAIFTHAPAIAEAVREFVGDEGGQ